MDFIIPVDHRIKIRESKKIDKYSYFARELKKLWNIRVTVIPIVVGALRMVPKSLEKGWRVGNQRKNWDHPGYSIVENGQNTEKCPGDLRRLAVTQIPVKDHQLKVVWKTHKW